MSTTGSARIAECISRLASLDDEIIALIRERGTTAAQLRMLRRLAGLREFQLAEENEVLTQYHDALDRAGTAIALQLLALGRSQRAERLNSVPERRMPSAA